MGQSHHKTRQATIRKKIEKKIHFPSRQARQPCSAINFESVRKIQRGGGKIERGMGSQADKNVPAIFFGISQKPRGSESDP